MQHRDISNLLIAFMTVMILLGSSSVWADAQQDADQLLADQNWSEAALAYDALLIDDGGNAGNWLALGTALEQLSRFEEARRAYDNAIAAGYQPIPRARFYLARVLAQLHQPDEALEQLEEIAKTGGPNFRTIRDAPAFVDLRENPRFVAVVEALTPCTAPEYRHFDFWLGEWNVTAAGATQPTASSSITSLHDGCVVLEQYVAGAFTGMSINFYDSVLGKWHQSWMSNAGGAVYLEGDLNEQGAMVMSDADLPYSEIAGAIGRTTWTPNEDGSVRQLWETSSDGGATWSTVFDGTYVRKSVD